MQTEDLVRARFGAEPLLGRGLSNAKFRTDELRSHIHRALDNGVTEEEIGELICHLAFYGGWPAAASAVNVARAAFDEHATRGNAM